MRRNLLPELLEVIRFDKSGRAARNPWVRRGRAVYGGYPFRGDPRLAVRDDVYRITKDEIPVVARVEQVWWDGDVIRLSGYAFIAFVPVDAERAGRVSLTLEESGHAVSVVALTSAGSGGPTSPSCTAPAARAMTGPAGRRPSRSPPSVTVGGSGRAAGD